jgi:Phage integrase family
MSSALRPESTHHISRSALILMIEKSARLFAAPCQSGDRQQAARVRCRRPQGRGRRAARLRRRACRGAPEKDRRAVRFEVTEQTRQAVDDYIRTADRKAGDFLFAAPRRPGRSLSTWQDARLVGDWIRGIGLDPCMFGTHSLRRTKATLIHRRTGNLRAVQLLLGHRKIKSTVGTSASRSTTLRR